MVQSDKRNEKFMDKVILITGASGGMGKELSKWFYSKGYSLALHYHIHPIEIQESSKVKLFQADLTVENQVNELVKGVIDAFGKIDVVINNAGISKSAMSWKTEVLDWKQTLALNLDAPFFMSKAVIPYMRAKKTGRIINVSSIVAQTGFIGTSAYAASKAGLLGLTKTLSKELASSGITVNALALGYFNVGMIEDVPVEMQEELKKQIPVKSLGEPITVCKTIEWLISDEANYVTGQTINLNGGLYS